jgi:alginate O-acetyltransferase complex protein AlgI
VLFNSYAFIFLFLPITLLGFHLIGGRGHHRIAIAWLVAASLFFYGWWNPAYLGLILGSMLFNYAVGVSLSGNPNRGVLALGIAANLGLLGYYKYANFFIDNLNAFVGSGFHLETIILPLAISFFTFQQIAYLVDAYRGETHEYRFLHYALFVTFFPQLIAGPIVHHKEMLPQFAKDVLYRLKAEHLAVGITIFAIGLFKKVVLADGIAVYATPVFDAAEAGVTLTFFEAWGGALAYTLQLYFDFSGYSDMAIGLARMFGVRLPLNFNSPYKATNIIDFWRRWHITLSRFLRDYLYIPLGGNRKGEVRRNINILITMLLGGLWHGAGWTFVLWGGLHGAYLVINHAWRRLLQNTQPTHIGSFFGWTITMLAVVAAWVPFRAESMEGAIRILEAMAGTNGFVVPMKYFSRLNEFYQFGEILLAHGISFGHSTLFTGTKQIGIGITMLLLVALAPNSHEIVGISTKKQTLIEWKPTKTMAFLVAAILFYAISKLNEVSEFLYFQF